MADNRKYYYLKLKESYFDDDASQSNIQIVYGDFGTELFCQSNCL